MIDPKRKQHFFMSCCTVLFEHEKSTVQMLENVVIAHNSKTIDQNTLGRIQHGARLQFFQEMESADIPIQKIVIQNIFYLGFMTPEEFAPSVVNQTEAVN